MGQVFSDNVKHKEIENFFKNISAEIKTRENNGKESYIKSYVRVITDMVMKGYKDALFYQFGNKYDVKTKTLRFWGITNNKVLFKFRYTMGSSSKWKITDTKSDGKAIKLTLDDITLIRSGKCVVIENGKKDIIDNPQPRRADLIKEKKSKDRDQDRTRNKDKIKTKTIPNAERTSHDYDEFFFNKEKRIQTEKLKDKSNPTKTLIVKKSVGKPGSLDKSKSKVAKPVVKSKPSVNPRPKSKVEPNIKPKVVEKSKTKTKVKTKSKVKKPEGPIIGYQKQPKTIQYAMPVLPA